MTPGRAEILTGLFVILTGLAGIAFALMLGGANWFSDGITYYAYLDNSADLRAQTAVHFEGRRVGLVTAVEWEAPRRAYKISLQLPPEVPVKEDSEMRLRGVKMLGDMFIEISAGSVGAAAARPGSELTAHPFRAMTESVDRLTEEISPVLAELRLAISDVRTLIDPNGAGGDLAAAVASVRDAAATLDRGATALETLINDPEDGLQGVSNKANRLLSDNQAAVSRGLTDAAEAAKSLRAMADDSRTPVHDILETMTKVMESLQATAARLDTTISTLDREMTQAGDAATSTIGQAQRMLRENQTDIRAAVIAARAAADNLRLAAAKVADRPSTLLFDSEDETSTAARAKRDFERQLRERGRTGRYGKE